MSGYISAPRRTRLKVRTYELLALLSSIVNKVYIDPKWVANKYLRRCKAAEWKKDINKDALKCWNLERIIDAKLFGKDEHPELSMEDLLRENEGAVYS